MTRHPDISAFGQARPVMPARRHAGQRAWLAGAAAEDRAKDAYARRGHVHLDSRWRGQSGEIDLILRDGDTYIFAEVKQAATLDAAIARLRPAQMRRIHGAAAEYLASTPRGQLSDVRFDLVAVDATGRAEILEGAFSHF